MFKRNQFSSWKRSWSILKTPLAYSPPLQPGSQGCRPPAPSSYATGERSFLHLQNGQWWQAEYTSSGPDWGTTAERGQNWSPVMWTLSCISCIRAASKLAAMLCHGSGVHLREEWIPVAVICSRTLCPNPASKFPLDLLKCYTTKMADVNQGDW